MNFTARQWTFVVVLDLLIKIGFVAFFGLLITMGAAPAIVFVLAAVVFSMLHGVCLLLGATLVGVIERASSKLPCDMNGVLTVVVANALFLGIWMAFASLPMHEGEIGSGALGDLILASVFVATNILPIMLVAAFSRLLRVIRRRSTPI